MFRKNFKHKVGDKQSFYSFRHSFIDELKDANLSKEKVHDLVGHSNQSIALDQYGSDAGYDELARNLELVDFSEVLKDVCPFIETKAYNTLKACHK
ncbi:hypothetical protein JCM19241_4827 [Vibrio ishigakensis]|uniref:Tyr recombinase domain-containing protein n=1 Tax=Vibrio ishigakensis TaxID=1481914 RepID=A0A0B8QM18_9VIBR|nr:hypothetical protein JCM19241_4827 [Vibrio ishigakensis]